MVSERKMHPAGHCRGGMTRCQFLWKPPSCSSVMLSSCRIPVLLRVRVWPCQSSRAQPVSASPHTVRKARSPTTGVPFPTDTANSTVGDSSSTHDGSSTPDSRLSFLPMRRCLCHGRTELFTASAAPQLKASAGRNFSHALCADRRCCGRCCSTASGTRGSAEVAFRFEMAGRGGLAESGERWSVLSASGQWGSRGEAPLRTVTVHRTTDDRVSDHLRTEETACSLDSPPNGACSGYVGINPGIFKTISVFTKSFHMVNKMPKREL